MANELWFIGDVRRAEKDNQGRWDVDIASTGVGHEGGADILVSEDDARELLGKRVRVSIEIVSSD